MATKEATSNSPTFLQYTFVKKLAKNGHAMIFLSYKFDSILKPFNFVFCQLSFSQFKIIPEITKFVQFKWTLFKTTHKKIEKGSLS
jgi:hypothetical protein